MVKICDKYPVDCNDFNEYFKYFDFELSDFQKWAIEAIKTGNHCLITAHTGSGKTLPAEFAILYSKSIGKKVIYTGPIKALCNQKLYDFRKKYPHISFGILTGDIKDNPEADVLIMTTEILRNTLFNKSINKTDKKPSLSFDMDFETELGFLIFDEIHYIADEDRGSVWEQSIIMLPKQVQLVMLSATIYKPENFAGWVENLKNNQDKDQDKDQDKQKNDVKDKEVYLCSTYERVVPLNHYMWLTCHQDTIKSAKKTPFELLLKKNLNCPVIISTSRDKRFNVENYESMIRLERYIDKCHRVKRPFVLNGLVNYLKNNDMIPALCFVFSRKHVEQCAKEINFSLFDADDTTPNIIENECKQMLIRKLPNYREYINLLEYINLIDLLKKGIAIHHAGIMPVLREIVELLFEKNYIKLLFATETFAVGLNMPTKTVIFTGLSKFDGNGMRDLHSHEYTQMAGRAGRRGLDTIGHVIHCNNLFQCDSSNSYKNMLTGGAKLLTSKFKISFNLILNIIYSKSLNTNRDNNNCEKELFAEVQKFVGKSMIQETLNREVNYFDKENAKLAMEIYDQQENVIPRLRSTVKVIEQYRDLETQLQNANKNKKRQIFAKMKELEEGNKTLVTDLLQYDNFNALIKEKADLLKDKHNTETYIDNTIQNVLRVLIDNHFIDANLIILDKGIIASQVQELHSLVLAEIYVETNGFNDYQSIDLAIFFSCFTSIRVDDACKTFNTDTHNLNKLFRLTEKIYDKYETQQKQYYIPDDTENNFHRDLINYVKEWYNASTEVQCMDIIGRVKIELDLFLGDFVKAIIKINNISMEIDKICEIMGNIELRHKISLIGTNILKYVATNQSLYV